MKEGTTIDLITMGCSKNLVDSERLIRQLEANGFTVTHDAEQPRGEIAVVNTCAFIADAQEESIQMILGLAQRKRRGELRRLYVMGCLPQRFPKELRKELPEVDKCYGKFDYLELLSDLGKSVKQELRLERRLTTPRHYAYLKISEGCDRHCAFCAIPLSTGRHKSRPVEEIVQEARWLASQGVRELQVVAQELTYYGLDLYGRRRIAELVERLADVRGLDWIRLHYAYPADFPMDLLRVMRERENVCKYLDIAFQHISDPVLKAMERNITSGQTYELIDKLRSEVPGVHLRTTLMVGFPGETEEQFEELEGFVKRVRFERLGAFAYSEEEGTHSAKSLKDDVPQEVKQERLSRIMRLQQRISAEVQGAKVGSVQRVMVDRVEGDYYVGRTEYDSPDVDPEVLIAKDKELREGEFCRCRIDEADDFDLYGSVIL
ncbi:MAG: 30S ribosomal protein S12 methylthiotransferase RimO [Prevotellaceae bacterium]|nr:30S ribosomal protein S12 methylthiotransferase RimO [Prevotellaceae bacterium]